jgi:uncharacterized protein YjdB
VKGPFPLLSIFVAVGCHDSTGPVLPSTVSVSPPGVTLIAGAVTQLSAAAITSRGDTVPGQAFSWTSSDTTIANITSQGLVVGVRPGMAMVRVQSASLEADVPIAILPRVDSLALSPDTVTNHVGDMSSLSLQEFDPTGAALGGRIVTWTSTDTMVVKVNVNALGPAAAGVEYTALATGMALVIASCEGKSDTATITVVP